MFKLYITARSKRSLPGVNKYHSANNKVRRPTEKKKREEQEWRFSLFLGSSVYRLWSHPEENQFQDPVWLSHLPASTRCVDRKTCDKANQEGEQRTFMSLPPKNSVSTCTSPTKLSESALGLLWRGFRLIITLGRRGKHKNKREKCFFKAAEEGFSTRPKHTGTSARTHKSRSTALQYLLAWGFVPFRFFFFFLTHTDKMMICTLASNPEQKRKREKKRKVKRNPFCTTVTSTGHESRPTPGMPPVRAEQSKAERSEAEWRVKREKWPSSLRKVWNQNWKGRENERHLLEPPLNSSGFWDVFISFFLCTSKMEKLFGGNLATCYSLCVTEIFYNTYCVVFFFVCFFFL